MRLLLFLVTLSLLSAACGGGPPRRTEKELEKMKAELEAKKQELSDKQEIAALEKELAEVERQIREVDGSGGNAEVKEVSIPSQPNAAPAPENTVATTVNKAKITASNVTMRKEASVQSEKIGSFESGEMVQILETKNVENDREAILSKPVTVKGEGGEVTLPKGKAVIIEDYQSERNYYLVTYEDPKKGKLTADVDASAVETITYSTWYRVKKDNGESGWILGKFLKTN